MIPTCTYADTLTSNMFEIKNMLDVDFINTISYLEYGVIAFNCYALDLNLSMFESLDKTLLEYEINFRKSFKKEELMKVYNPNNGVIILNKFGEIEYCHYAIFMKHVMQAYKILSENSFGDQLNRMLDILNNLKKSYPKLFNRKITLNIIKHYFINYKRMNTSDIEKEILDLVYNRKNIVFEDLEMVHSQQIKELQELEIVHGQQIKELQQTVGDLQQTVNKLQQSVNRLVLDLTPIINKFNELNYRNNGCTLQ